MAGQADKMGILQAYKADLFRELDEGKGVEPDMVADKELRKATDLSLPATKETARAIGHSMTAMVVKERHLWMNLSGIKERDKSFLLDTPLSPPGIFGDTVNTVFKDKKQAAAFQRFIPYQGQVPAAQAIGKLLISPAAERECRISSLPQQDWGLRRHSGGKTDLRTVILGKKALGKRS